ncbi:MAG: hypothetical protein MUE67_07925 [Anaerolineales bacterium]|nr:hypothetical protein [Anaerolineales bacterium]
MQNLLAVPIASVRQPTLQLEHFSWLQVILIQLQAVDFKAGIAKAEAKWVERFS